MFISSSRYFKVTLDLTFPFLKVLLDFIEWFNFAKFCWKNEASNSIFLSTTKSYESHLLLHCRNAGTPKLTLKSSMFPQRSVSIPDASLKGRLDCQRLNPSQRGTHFVRSITYGGELIASIKITMRSRAKIDKYGVSWGQKPETLGAICSCIKCWGSELLIPCIRDLRVNKILCAALYRSAIPWEHEQITRYFRFHKSIFFWSLQGSVKASSSVGYSFNAFIERMTSLSNTEIRTDIRILSSCGIQLIPSNITRFENLVSAFPTFLTENCPEGHPLQAELVPIKYLKECSEASGSAPPNLKVNDWYVTWS